MTFVLLDLLSRLRTKVMAQMLKRQTLATHQAGYPKIASKVLDSLIGPQIDGDGNQGPIRLSAQGEALFLGGRRCPNKKKNNQKLKKR